MVRFNYDPAYFDRDQMFQSLRQTGEFFDVTLACEGSQVEAHKVILSATSTVLQQILKKNTSPHPVIFLKGTKKILLENVVDFLYKGSVEVEFCNLEAFMELAADLKIKGLDFLQKKNPIEKFGPNGYLDSITEELKCDFCEAPLTTNLPDIWFHYSVCYYNQGALFEKLPPGPHNSDERGKPIDEVGVDVFYNCDEMHCCYTDKKLGYKEFLLHQAMCHRILEEVIVENQGGHVPELLQEVLKISKKEEFRFRAECFHSKIKSLNLGQQRKRQRRRR